MTTKETAFHRRRMNGGTPQSNDPTKEQSASPMATPRQHEAEINVRARAPPETMLRLKAVMARTGKSRTTIWRNVRAGTFPSPVKTGSNTIAWFESEIQQWQDDLERAWEPSESEVE